MRLYEISNFFKRVMYHETTPENAKSILKNGFRLSDTGIFFNTTESSYTNGGYGGYVITAEISGPADGILDLTNDEPEELEDADGYELADYARNNNYWAWKDGIQMAVLNTNHIKILRDKF